MKKPTLVILAAGLGSRFGGLKQLESIGPYGETIVEYSVYDALKAGFGKVVFVIKKEMEKVCSEQLLTRFGRHIETAFVFQDLNDLPDGFTVPNEREKPWGTTHAVLTAECEVNSPFAVINADDFYGFDAYNQMAKFLMNHASDAHFAMVGYRLAHTLSKHGTVSRGICDIDKKGFLRTVTEHTKINLENGLIISHDHEIPIALKEDDLVSMNFWGFTPVLFPQLRKEFTAFLEKNSKHSTAECYLPLVIDRLIQQNKVCVSVLDSDAEWFGITYSEDKQSARESILQKIQSGDYPKNLWA